MAVQRSSHVTVEGDVSGEYIVVEEHEDGSLVFQSDTSMEAIRQRQNATPATLEEFEAEYGPL